MAFSQSAQEHQASGNVPSMDVKRIFFRRKKEDPLADIPESQIDYKNLRLLRRFISERGRILPRRITGVSAKNQRKLTRAIKQARNLALLPFVAQ